MESLNGFRVRMTVDGDCERVASFAIFSALFVVSWKMLMTLSVIPSSWFRWGWFVRKELQVGDIMLC